MDRATLLTLDHETLMELVVQLAAEQATAIAALQEQGGGAGQLLTDATL